MHPRLGVEVVAFEDRDCGKVIGEDPRRHQACQAPTDDHRMVTKAMCHTYSFLVFAVESQHTSFKNSSRPKVPCCHRQGGNAFMMRIVPNNSAKRVVGTYMRRPNSACASCCVDPRMRRSAYCGCCATACASCRWAAARAA